MHDIRSFFLATLSAVFLIQAVQADAQASAAANPDANPFGRKYPPRVYQTMRVGGSAPVVDGRLDDEAWSQGEWAGDYIQNMPTEGAKPSQPTELKILYDDRYVYMAIRAYDDPAKVHRYASRRDDFNNYEVDIVGVCFDSYNDKRTGFEFDLTAGGAKIDLVLGNGETEWDTTWDAVWDGKVAHDDKGWTAEFRVPLSQLRYGPQEEQVWGMHAWRWIARNQEEDQWQLIPRQNTGRMYQLGELRGIGQLPPSRRVEILPHVLGRASSGPSVAGGGTDGAAAGGLDAKVGIATNFTLDATVNPDFGQVEADPSVINLTAYETFYDEKRPFFLEGRKMFGFEIEEGDQLFYSRRIGEAPSRAPSLASGETAAMPEGTTILGAFKVTGKTSRGLTVAALQAVTQKEVVQIRSPLGDRSATVEPFGSYTVGRLHKDWDKGNTSLGTMFTTTSRWISDAALASLPTHATTAGFDFNRYLSNRRWALETNAAFSRVTGDEAAILALQRNAVHYYQRAGASHLGVNAGRTSLSGHGGSARFGLSDTSRLRLLDHFHWYSPGFDLNDAGYLRQADVMSNQVFLGWSETTPRGAFRSYSVQLAREDQWDFGGLKTGGATELEASATFSNKWNVSAMIESNQTVDTRALRGGPALRLSDGYHARVGFGSDASRRLSLSASGGKAWAVNGGTDEIAGDARLRFRPSNLLSLSAEAAYSRGTNDLQYVATPQPEAAGGGTGPGRWVLGRIDQRVWNLIFRANLSLTPELTIQYYGSPFIATGRYTDFKRAADTLAASYGSRFHRYGSDEIAYSAAGARYVVAEGGGPSSYSFADPDFSFRQFRSNLVTRWEWKPGSSFYVVWSQGRTANAPAWDGSFGRNWTGLWNARADNVFLVKVSYWVAP